MENEERRYRLKSTPDLIIDLASLGIAEIVTLDDSLLAQQHRLAQDRVQLYFEMDHRLLED